MYTRFLASLNPLVYVALAAVLFAGPALGQQDRQLVDGIVAVVGTHPILRSDIDAMALTMSRGGTLTTTVRRAALEELITQQIVATQAARDTTVIVLEEEVTQVLDQRTDELVQQVGSEAAVEQLYNRSLPQLKEDYRRDVRRQLLAQALQRRVYFDVRVTPQEVRQWFSRIPADSLPEIPELVRVAHIVRFPQIEPEAREQARTKTETIRDSILAGVPIEELARRHSDDPGSRNQGGRYASINIRDLVPEFGAVAGVLAPGELSQVFESDFGYHVMRLNERRGDVIDFNHVLIQIDAARTDPSEALATLETVRDSIVTHGRPFARMARDYSEDESSATRGGNIVVPQTGDRDLRFEALGPQWRATLDTLEVGEVSRPAQVNLLDGRSAYHIVMLQRRVPPHTMALETDYALAEELALQDKRQRVMQEWIEGLRDEVFVSCKDDVLCTPANTAASARR
jgi:peptidyl-prolyl cis-trans isomerase SurA